MLRNGSDLGWCCALSDPRSHSTTKVKRFGAMFAARSQVEREENQNVSYSYFEKFVVEEDAPRGDSLHKLYTNCIREANPR